MGVRARGAGGATALPQIRAKQWGNSGGRNEKQEVCSTKYSIGYIRFFLFFNVLPWQPFLSKSIDLYP